MTFLREMIEFGGWAMLWALGGWWLARSCFNLSRHEQLLCGVALGLALENWLSNLLARFFQIPQAFWLASAIVFLAGIAFSLPLKRDEWKEMTRIPFPIGQILGLVGLTLLLTLVGRGMAILEDYQNLPTISIMATGDIPPHFALDPKLVFNYHYDTLLFSTQLVKIGRMFVWVAIDVARGFGFALSLLLGSLYVRRVTRSQTAGIVSILAGMFVGGTRWMMLLLPENWLAAISNNINMIGSSASSASTLSSALLGPWQVETGSPFPIPFAFSSGINPPNIWTYHAGAGAISGIASAFLLLTHNRWRGWRSGFLSAILVASIALGAELGVVSLVGCLFLMAVIYMISNHTWKIPTTLRNWLIVGIIATAIAAFQGGVLTGAVSDLLVRIFPHGAPANGSYFTGGFRFLWPPAFLSSHLGYLSFANPYQAAAALFEIGPLIFILPLVLIWGWKTYKFRRWYEAAFFLGAVLSIFLAFVDYTGSAGPTAITRIQAGLVNLPKGWAVPVLWVWARNRSANIKTGVAVLFFVSMFGGIALFGYEMIGVARPNYSTFITVLDARIMRDQWNKLEPGALVFDPIASRAPTVLGRYTNSNITWYTSKPEWSKLADSPKPRELRAYGFSYAYWDLKNWDLMDQDLQQLWKDPCVKQISEYEVKIPYDFRRLFDIRECQP
jgi:hypothetical protein